MRLFNMVSGVIGAREDERLRIWPLCVMRMVVVVDDEDDDGGGCT